jgi:U-box domain
MMFHTDIMADPVVASDGFTYERVCMEQWMQGHDTSPTTREPLEHKFLIPNHDKRKQIAAWCEKNGVPVPKPPKPAAKPAAAGEGAAAAVMDGR